jgi:hypothetical protein
MRVQIMVVFTFLVAEGFLHCSDVIAQFQQVRGRAMPDRVAGGMLRDASLSHCGLHGPLREEGVDLGLGCLD